MANFKVLLDDRVRFLFDCLQDWIILKSSHLFWFFLWVTWLFLVNNIMAGRTYKASQINTKSLRLSTGKWITPISSHLPIHLPERIINFYLLFKYASVISTGQVRLGQVQPKILAQELSIYNPICILYKKKEEKNEVNTQQLFSLCNIPIIDSSLSDIQIFFTELFLCTFYLWAL